ncbi:hypothetical protein METSMIF1_02145 [Methanobrevibacter smithii DSM 2374]|uniref:Uncharacterized protein n=1 Tax=Methanobrevibacter smithii DSM 2374 TaxID=521002 RepID=D2ZMU5_METSM|nr:DUF5750 family protein [Methanobrevibacter smithii]EFC94173.1 hypothetical protein METSMIF1_02145 [Methanobrevibacter smithii DSM 2374]MDO5830809.1 hypothetical protein [Methanobrevibacter smithii]
MDVRIVDYGENADGGFISYNISGLSQNQLEFLNNNLDDETQITIDNLILKTKFKKEFFPFQSRESKIKVEDFISREEIEMAIFLSSFLEDMD